MRTGWDDIKSRRSDDVPRVLYNIRRPHHNSHRNICREQVQCYTDCRHHTIHGLSLNMTSTTDFIPCYPVDDPTVPFWKAELDSLDELRTTSELPQESDIVIIGAGYAGVSIAYHLLKSQSQQEKSHPLVTILEARQICSGATGRNG